MCEWWNLNNFISYIITFIIAIILIHYKEWYEKYKIKKTRNYIIKEILLYIKESIQPMEFQHLYHNCTIINNTIKGVFCKTSNSHKGNTLSISFKYWKYEIYQIISHDETNYMINLTKNGHKSNDFEQFKKELKMNK